MNDSSAYDAIVARAVALRRNSVWKGGEEQLRDLETALKALGAPPDADERRRIWGEFAEARKAYREARTMFFADRQTNGAAGGRPSGSTQSHEQARWTEEREQKTLDQAIAKRAKEGLISELQTLLNGEPNHSATLRVKALGAEFLRTGYAGTTHNGVLAARFAALRGEYMNKLEAIMRRAQTDRDRIARDMDHALFVLERIAHGADVTDRWDKWTEESAKYRGYGYPGKEKKAELDARFARLRDELSRAIGRDREKRQREREAQWTREREQRAATSRNNRSRW